MSIDQARNSDGLVGRPGVMGRKRVCDFLLVRRSILGPIVQCSGDFARVVLLTPPLFHPNFGVFPTARCTRSPTLELL